jgi:hypothetical protein
VRPHLLVELFMAIPRKKPRSDVRGAAKKAKQPKKLRQAAPPAVEDDRQLALPWQTS